MRHSICCILLIRSSASTSYPQICGRCRWPLHKYQKNSQAHNGIFTVHKLKNLHLPLNTFTWGYYSNQYAAAKELIRITIKTNDCNCHLFSLFIFSFVTMMKMIIKVNLKHSYVNIINYHHSLQKEININEKLFRDSIFLPKSSTSLTAEINSEKQLSVHKEKNLGKIEIYINCYKIKK